MMVSGQGMLHVKLVQRAYELSDAVGTHTREDHLPEIAALVETLAAVLQQPLATEVSDDVALVARLVLEDHATSAPQANRYFPAAGSAALQLIQQAAFACDPAGMAFSDLVQCTSTQQAAMVCSMCHAALRDVICDSGTCIPLLMTAEAQQWRSIESRCLAVATEDPMASLGAGAAVTQLSKRALRRILSSDNLKVGRELDVWHLLQQWLDADPTARSQSVASFMTGPLRLLQLSRSDLNELDCHPAVRRCGISSRLVAAAYLHASGHSADLCSQMALPPLWAQLANAQPRLSLAMAAQPATPTQAVRPAPGEMLTDMSDDTIGTPPFLSLVDVTPVRLHGCSPTAEAPHAQEAVGHSPEGPWMISSDDWDDATETACWEQINLARHRKRLRMR